METNAAALWAVIQSRRFRLGDCFFTTFADELVDGGHNAIVLGWRLSGFVELRNIEIVIFAGSQPERVAGRSSEIPRKSHFSGEHPIVVYLIKGLNRCILKESVMSGPIWGPRL